MWEKLKALLAGLGVTIPDDKLAEVQAAVEKELQPPAPAKPATPAMPATPPTPALPAGIPSDLSEILVKAIQTANAPLIDRIDKADKVNETLKTQLDDWVKKEQEQKIATVLTEALRDGKITKEQEATYKQRLTDSFDVTKAILDERQKNSAVAADDKGGDKGSDKGAGSGQPAPQPTATPDGLRQSYLAQKEAARSVFAKSSQQSQTVN